MYLKVQIRCVFAWSTTTQIQLQIHCIWPCAQVHSNTLKYTQIHSTTFLSEDAVCKVAHCARVSDAYLKKVDKNAKKRKYLTNTDRYAQIRVNTAGNTFGKK